ncbi:precorrin-8X methylmutase [Thermodesulfatator indicus]
MILKPQEIEKESFRIIENLLSKEGLSFPEEYLPLVKRVIHTTGDISLAKDLVFHPLAVSRGIKALKSGGHIFCDVKMVVSGINQKELSRLGGKVCCYIDDEEVIKEAQRRGITRAICSVEKAISDRSKNIDIFVIGNAPTALLALIKALEKGARPPSLIIGVPVGFVGAAEYKALLVEKSPAPYITLLGTRGGSTIAVALVNALIKLAL